VCLDHDPGQLRRIASAKAGGRDDAKLDDYSPTEALESVARHDITVNVARSLGITLNQDVVLVRCDIGQVSG